MPDGVIRLRGSDRRLSSKCGLRKGSYICSTEEAGHLVYGPYVFLTAGRYEVRLHGSFAGLPGPNPNIEVAANGGNQLLARCHLYAGYLDDDVRKLVFDAHNDIAEVEVRVWVEASNVVTLSLLEIERVSA